MTARAPLRACPRPKARPATYGDWCVQHASTARIRVELVATYPACSDVRCLPDWARASLLIARSVVHVPVTSPARSAVAAAWTLSGRLVPGGSVWTARSRFTSWVIGPLTVRSEEHTSE